MRADTAAFEDPVAILPVQPTDENLDNDAAMPNAVAPTGGAQHRGAYEDCTSAIGSCGQFDAPKARGRWMEMPVAQAARCFEAKALPATTTEQRVNVRWGFRVGDIGYGSDRATSVRSGSPSKETSSLHPLRMTSALRLRALPGRRAA